jgi:hypothetical protein
MRWAGRRCRLQAVFEPLAGSQALEPPTERGPDLLDAGGVDVADDEQHEVVTRFHERVRDHDMSRRRGPHAGGARARVPVRGERQFGLAASVHDECMCVTAAGPKLTAIAAR